MKELSSYNAKELEAEVLKFWEEKKIPQGLAAKRKGATKYFVLDGPPYVNALPHVGHVKTTTSKDIWTRLKYMQGYDTHIQPGFDCHGLPVEVIVEKELGITNKREIIENGIEKFDAACLSKITNNEKSWLAYYKRLGAWRAFFEPYFTYKPSYIESGWWTFKTLHEKGFVSEGMRSTHWCPHCETALSGYEVSDSYKNVTDPSIFIKFKVKGTDNEYLLVWTTTPWTLPGNVGIAAAPDEKYAKVKVNHNGREEILIMGLKRVEPVLKEKVGIEYEIVGELMGSELDGMRYEPIVECGSQASLDGNPAARRVYLSIPIMVRKKYKKHVKKEEAGAGSVKCRVACVDCKAEQIKEVNAEEAGVIEVGAVVESGFCEKCDGHNGFTLVEKNAEEKEFEHFVTMTEGTGLVHTAPGHGSTDNLFGKHYGLPQLSPVDEAGKFTELVAEWQGKFVKGADKLIIEYLDNHGRLLMADKVTHSYPLCWRCKTPLIFRLSNQIYLSVENIKEPMLADNEKTNWMPPYGQDAFGNWVAQATDWCISQQRFWGIPIPLWKCQKCGAGKVIGSTEELAQNAAGKLPPLDDLHRHTVDAIELKCHACDGRMKRIPDIFNVWFDSGIAPWASLGYPKRNAELFESMFPVNMINESQDQVRGWFYALSFASHAAFGKPAFENCSMMGWVLDEKGVKMSKSLGNVVGAEEAIDKLGADPLRLYFCWEIAPWDVQKFSFQTAMEVVRSINILWNSYKFIETYGTAKTHHAKLALEDKWIISRLNTVCAQTTQHLEAFEFHLAGRKLMDFVVNDFSRWYIKLVRDRASGSDEESRNAAIATMKHVVNQTAIMLAPITPHVSEYLYQKLDAGEESVHYCTYPTPQAAEVNAHLEESMAIAMAVTEAANGLRQEAKVKLRWPLAELRVEGGKKVTDAAKELAAILESQNNVLKVAAGAGHEGWVKASVNVLGSETTVWLDIERDEQLVMLGRYREAIRAVQASRKDNGFVVSERIKLTMHSGDAAFNAFLKTKEKELCGEVGASEVKVVDSEAGLTGSYKVEMADAGGKAAYSRA